MDIIAQIKQVPATDMGQMVARWSKIMVPAQSARKRGRDDDEDTRPRARVYTPSNSGVHQTQSETPVTPAPCKTSY